MKNLNLGEAFGSIFQKDWWKKYLGLFAIYLVPIIPAIIAVVLIVVAGIMKDNLAVLIIAIIMAILFILSAIIIQLITNIFINGYFMLYGHDRALDKNATYRPVFSKETFKEGLIAGVKGIVVKIIMIPFFFLLIFPLFIILITTLILKIEIVGILLTLSLFILGAFLISIPIVKIMSYFIKDMELVSLFRWGRAFEYSKGVKNAIWVAILPFLLIVPFFILCKIGFAILPFVYNFDKITIDIISNTVSIFLQPIIIFIFFTFYYNLLGQYTYAAIKQNEDVEPETKEKEVNTTTTNTNNNTTNTTNTTTIIIIVVAILIAVSILPIIGVIAALTIPSLVNRQSGLAAMVKMKKAISQYETIAEVYMAENSTNKTKVTDLKDFAGKDCEKLGNYFKIVKKYDKCAFTTADGIYWLFDPTDGSVNVSDNDKNPKYNITLGVCKDGTVNCIDEYPDVMEFLKKQRP